MKQIIKQLGKWLAVQGLKMFFNYVDKDKDKKLSEKEIKAFVKEVQGYIKK